LRLETYPSLTKYIVVLLKTISIMDTVRKGKRIYITFVQLEESSPT